MCACLRACMHARVCACVRMFTSVHSVRAFVYTRCVTPPFHARPHQIDAIGFLFFRHHWLCVLILVLSQFFGIQI